MNTIIGRIDPIMKTVCGAALALLVLSGFAVAQTQTQNVQKHLDACNAVANNHTSGSTTTITPPGNYYVYICAVDLQNCEGAAVTPATPLYITTTGFTGLPEFLVGSGPAVSGTCSQALALNFSPGSFQSSTPGAAVTFVMPAFVGSQLINLNVWYFTGP